ncbi:hypothetical protein E4U27_004364, partial [Claviceps purpurea]
GFSSLDFDTESLSYETDSDEGGSSELSHPWDSSELAPSYEAAVDYALKLLNSQGTLFEDTSDSQRAFFTVFYSGYKLMIKTSSTLHTGLVRTG